MLRVLPFQRRETRKPFRVRVSPGSTIRVQHNVYSVPSRLIGEWVEVRLGAEDLELWHGQRLMECLPRLRGEKRHRIEYRHIIEWLVRKPGAFAAYRYRQELFPSSRFRLAYDHLRSCQPLRADKEYLALLLLAAKESEERVEAALCHLLTTGESISSTAVKLLIGEVTPTPAPLEVAITPVNLGTYDGLLEQTQWWSVSAASESLSSESQLSESPSREVA